MNCECEKEGVDDDEVNLERPSDTAGKKEKIRKELMESITDTAERYEGTIHPDTGDFKLTKISVGR